MNNAENAQHPALPNRPNRSFRVGAAVVGVALVLIVILAFLMIARIEPGFAGVVYSPSGGVEEDVLNQGWHIIAPFKRVTEYPVSTETSIFRRMATTGTTASTSPPRTEKM